MHSSQFDVGHHSSRAFIRNVDAAPDNPAAVNVAGEKHTALHGSRCASPIKQPSNRLSCHSKASRRNDDEKNELAVADVAVENHDALHGSHHVLFARQPSNRLPHSSSSSCASGIDMDTAFDLEVDSLKSPSNNCNNSCLAPFPSETFSPTPPALARNAFHGSHSDIRTWELSCEPDRLKFRVNEEDVAAAVAVDLNNALHGSHCEKSQKQSTNRKCSSSVSQIPDSLSPLSPAVVRNAFHGSHSDISNKDTSCDSDVPVSPPCFNTNGFPCSDNSSLPSPGGYLSPIDHSNKTNASPSFTDPCYCSDSSFCPEDLDESSSTNVSLRRNPKRMSRNKSTNHLASKNIDRDDSCARSTSSQDPLTDYTIPKRRRMNDTSVNRTCVHPIPSPDLYDYLLKLSVSDRMDSNLSFASSEFRSRYWKSDLCGYAISIPASDFRKFITDILLCILHHFSSHLIQCIFSFLQT